MKKLLLSAVFSTAIIFTMAQGFQSPDQYLGYPIGSRYTRHHKIVDYFRAVAAAMPEVVKIQKYGETNEGRDLILAFIASPENLANLENIRLNNLRMAGLTRDKMAPQTDNAPAIVWLSYNVHGNETSSSEAAMLTLYTLADPKNANSKEWLKNTIVVIDPCINPDGRDRYVNWFNGVVGKKFNPDPNTREHAEPWPGGRTNHYNFDLNRDWAWQTQVETRQRLLQYNHWLPQVHVDFHEQGINEPYYFAPAANPYHEVITPWQRDFQAMIGKNNARYFDKNGWLFFTKERFDLLYPSYGDTYPIYNGAIGMTFEQGGGPRGGLGVINESGDTLTLHDRMMHHYTTGLSTIETASRNRQRLIDEFNRFYNDGRSGKVGDYKTYVLTSSNLNKINAVIDLLDKNDIQYGKVSGFAFKGFHYATGKEESFTDQGYQVAISAYQPKAVLAKVLLEPKTVVTDSNTYDITAWSVPYAYGVDAYAVKEKLDLSSMNNTYPVVSEVVSDYGVLIPYGSFDAARVMAHLLNKGIKVRFAEKPFTYDGKIYDQGTLIILKTSNPVNWNQITNQVCQQFHIQPVAVSTGLMDKGMDFGSPDVKIISKALRVALLTGDQTSAGSAGEVWHFFEQQLDYPLSLINATDIGRVNLDPYDVLIMPNGYYRMMNDKPNLDKIREFVRKGGKLIAMDNAVSILARNNFGIRIKEDKPDDKSDYASVKKYADREEQSLTNSLPGAIYKLELDNTHPLGFGYPDYYFTLKQDTDVFEFLKEGWNVGIMKKDAYVSGFVGYKVKAKLKDGVVIGTGNMGSGSVTYFTEDPLFRNFWENGKLLFCNAVFLVGQ